jgi:NAD(P)-dependent dehydrogenase (short-subunit alcohol dehydrogenase family)
MTGTAIVTGGTGGLGAAVVARLLDDGWHTVVPWVVERELERVQERDGLTLVRADLFEPDEVAAVVEAAAGDGEAPLRGLVNLVGGFAAGGRVHETPIEEFERQFRLNLRATYLMTQAFVSRVLGSGAEADRGEGGGSAGGRDSGEGGGSGEGGVSGRGSVSGGGVSGGGSGSPGAGGSAHGGGSPGGGTRASIVCVGTRAVRRPFSGAAGYIASKAAVLSFTEAVAVEYRDDGIRCNAILPSVIDTPGNRASMPKADFSRWVKPAEIAGVIAHLLSEDSSPVSGAAIPVYGRA